MKIGFLMEPLEALTPAESNSLILMREAAKRGYEVYHFTAPTLGMEGGNIVARAAPMAFGTDLADFREAGPREHMDLTLLDAVVMRQLPPFDMGYITSTYMLEQLQKQGVFVSNDPAAIRNAPEKLVIFDYPGHIPPTLVSRDMTAIERFLHRHGEVVVKPLYDYFGQGIIRTRSAGEIQARLTAHPAEPLMFQPFLKEIFEGNKRIVLFDGEIVGAIRTVPLGDDFRIYRESRDDPYDPTAQERELCRKIGEDLGKKGLHFIGLDLIGDRLTEINATCVGSLVRLNAVYGERYEVRFWDMLEPKIKAVKG